MPDAALTPDLAIAYLRELSTDIRAAVVLAADGRRLAGGEAMAAAVREILAASEAPLIEVETARGMVVVARTDTHALAVAAGRQALPALVRFDARRTVADLSGSAA